MKVQISSVLVAESISSKSARNACPPSAWIRRALYVAAGVNGATVTSL